MLFIILLCLAMPVTLWVAARMSDSGDLDAIRRYVSAQGWAILFFERAHTGRYGPTRYKLRCQDQAGAVHEIMLETDSASTICGLYSNQLPKALQIAMTDLSMEMDCRKCGTTIPKLSEQCPYCHTSRDFFPTLAVGNMLITPSRDGSL